MKMIFPKRVGWCFASILSAGLWVGCDAPENGVINERAGVREPAVERPAVGAPGTAREATAEIGEETERGTGVVVKQFPTDENAIIRVEQRMPAQVRVGEQFTYTIRVVNVSEEPVHDLVLREQVTGVIDVANVQRGQEEQQTAQGGSGEQAQQEAGQQTSEQGQQQQQQAQRQQAQTNQPPQTNAQVRQQQTNEQAQGAPGLQRQQQQGQEQGQAQAQQQQPQQRRQQQAQQNQLNQRAAMSPQQRAQMQQQAQQTQGAQQEQGGQNTRTWRVGTLMPGEAKSIEVTAAPQQEGQARTCLTVDYKPTLCAEITVVQPELRLERWIVNEEGQPVDRIYECQPAIIVYRVTNTGSGTTEPVVIREQLPNWVGTTDQQPDIDIPVEPLSAGETAVKRVPVQFTQAGQFSGRAVATTGKLKVQSRASGLEILKPQIDVTIDGPQEQYLNRPVQYTVTVMNRSIAPAPQTRVMLNIPETAERVHVSSQQIQREGNQFLLGTLRPQERRSFTVSFEPSQIGTIALRAQARAYCAAPKVAQVSTEVIGIPAVRLEVIDLQDPVAVGEETTYAIRVKNQGSAEDLNINLQATLPNELEFVSADGDTPVQRRQDSLRFGPVQELAPGELVEWRVRARATEANRVKFQVNLQSNATREPVSEAEPTTLY